MIEDAISQGPGYNVGYNQGFNQGMQKAAEQFPLIVVVLCCSFALKILIQAPPIQKRVNDNVVQAVLFGSDILAFFLTLVLLYSYLGLPL